MSDFITLSKDKIRNIKAKQIEYKKLKHVRDLIKLSSDDEIRYNYLEKEIHDFIEKL